MIVGESNEIKSLREEERSAGKIFCLTGSSVSLF